MNTVVYFLITPWGELGNDDWWLRDQSVFRLLSTHHWVWLEFEVRGHKHKQTLTCTPKLLHAPRASGDKMFVTAAAAAVCMSIPFLPPTIWLPLDLVQVSSVTVTILVCVCFFFFLWFYSPGPPSGPLATGPKPLALFRDFTSHSVWKEVLLTVSSEWWELPVKEVSTEVWKLMYWICCSTGWEGQEGGEGVRTTVLGEEMEMYGETDRCKIQGEREKRAND